MWDGASWQDFPSGPQEATALAVAPSGELLIAGRFGQENGERVVAKFDGSHWAMLGSAFKAAAAGTSPQMNSFTVLENGDIAIGGSFYFVGNTPIRSVAIWNGSNWSGLPSAPNGTVRALVTVPGGFVAAGIFLNTTNGALFNHIARWNGTEWSALGDGMRPSSPGIFTLLRRANGNIVAGGNFNQAGASPAAHIAEWNGATWTALGSGITSPASARVFSLAETPGGRLLVGGSFANAGGVVAPSIARWSGSQWEAISGGASDSSVWSILALSESKFIAVGDFSMLGGVPANGIAMWTGETWTALSGASGGLNKLARAVAVLPNGHIVAGGNFTQAGGEDASFIAKWDGTRWSNFGNTISGTVAGLTVAPNGDVIASGFFSKPGLRIARWHGAAWQSLGTGIGSPNPVFPNVEIVNAAVVLPNGDVVAGGQFSTAGGKPAKNIARWNGSEWFAIGDGVTDSHGSASVLALAVLPNGDLVAGGVFDHAGTVAANNIARFDGTTWLPFGEGVIGLVPESVRALLVHPDGGLVVGGTFYYAGQVNTNGIARWKDNQWSALGTGMSGPGASFSRVQALSMLPGGDVCAAGYFDKAGGVSVNSIARWNGSEWLPMNTGVTHVDHTAQVYALALHPAGELVVAGDFTSAGPVLANYWARWSELRQPWIASPPSPKTVIAGESLVLKAAPANGFGSLAFQWLRNAVNVQEGPGGASPGGGTVSGSSGVWKSDGTDSSIAFTIAAVQLSDAGLYHVEFSSTCGDATSIPVEVKVKAHITDINADGQVDDADFLLFSIQYDFMLCTDPLMPDACSADFNHDGIVDDADFAIFIPAFNAMLFN